MKDIFKFFPGRKNDDETIQPESPIEFHIKVVPWSDGDSWEIHYTKNNWLTSTPIWTLIDLNSFCMLHPLFKKDEALTLAAKFTSYEECEEYNRVNRQEYERLDKIYKDEKAAKKELEEQQKPPRLDTEIFIR